MQILQQFTEINIIMYYAPKIFIISGFNNILENMWGTIIVGLTNVLAIFIAIFFVEKLGRKPILITGSTIMAIGMGTLSLIFNRYKFHFS